MSTTSIVDGSPASPVHVLVVGHGTLGHCLIRAFTSSDSQYRIRTFLLVRPATVYDPATAAKLAAYKHSGVTLLVGDINDTAALTDAMRAAAITTVVSAVGHSAHLDQLSLLEAAKAAGVERFFPSEFGFDESDMDVEHSPLHTLLDNKRRVRNAIRASGVDWTVIQVGAFLEWFIDSDFFGLDIANNTITAPGSLSAAITLTSLHDIGQLTALAVLDDNTRNTVLRLGQPITYQQAADLVDTVNSHAQAPRRPPMTRRVKTIDERQKEMAANPGNLPARFAILLAQQIGISWPEQQTYGYQQAGRQLTTFEEAVEELSRSKAETRVDKTSAV